MRTGLAVLLCSLAWACGDPSPAPVVPTDTLTTTSSPVTVAAEGLFDKVIVGYQGWFAAEPDSSQLNEWSHWGRSLPSPGNVTFELYPDTREYDPADLFQTGLGALGDGRPAKLFGSHSPRVVDLHFRWMQQHGIDGVVLQRFVSTLGDPRHFAFRNDVTRNVRAAAEAHGRVFYLEYDVSGANEASWVEDTQRDWTQTMEGALHLTASPQYLRHGGKPVVALWGFGFPDRPGTAARSIELIEWFKAQGCYVIGGVPYGWRTGGGTKPGFESVWAHLNVIQPWAVGAIHTEADASAARANVIDPDKRWAQQHGVEYQRVIFPGFAWSNWNGGSRNMIPRKAGRFLWAQARAARQSGVSVFLAMFDEVDEGTAILKVAEDASMIPTNQYFLTLDADGTRVSSDFYLRLTGALTRLMKGQAPDSASVPVPAFEGAPPPPPPPPPSGPPPATGGNVPKQTLSADVAGPTFTASQAQLIVQRLYRGVMGREVDPSGEASYTPLVQQGRLARVVNALVGSGEFEARRSGLTTDGWSVQLYQTLLDRDPDPSGVQSTSAAIAAARGPDRIEGIVRSAEYAEKNP